MPDNWSYVAAAYVVAVILLGGYWRHLVRRGRQVGAAAARRGPAPMPPGRGDVPRAARAASPGPGSRPSHP